MKKIFIKVLVLFLVSICLSHNLFAQTRIRFAKGRTSATVSGTVGGNGERSYVLRARYGQYISANVSSRSDCVIFSNRATSLSYITESGDNYLFLTNNCRRQVSFTLTVSINYGSD